jgi:UDP-N-acetylmuramoyl-tripeptide--D-alanyl-D-alanine ligase
MTRTALEAAFSVHASRGNLNNLYGCPLSILEIGEHHQVSVLEMGMSHHGELKRLAEIADPDIGVLTNVNGAHLAHFSSIEDVAAAKAELFEGMRSDSIGIFNNDDEHCRRIMGSFKGYAVTFGIDRASDLTATGYRPEGLEGSSFEIRHAQKSGSRRVRTCFVGVHNVYNALAAMSVGYMLGIDLEGMAESLGRLSPLGMRGQVVRLGESVRILDESYNSNPAAMRYALKMLEEARPEGRKVLVFGDMLELGESEVEAHRELGREIRDAGPDVIVGVGPLAAEALAALEDCIASPNGKLRMHRFAGSEEASRFVAGMARPGDLFLVKGSRGIALEKVVAALRERFGEE